MNATISARILHHIAQGQTLAQAIDAVLGAGTYETLASDLYRALRGES